MNDAEDRPILPNGNEKRVIVGLVTEGERDEIRALFERKNGLLELFRSLSGLSEQELHAGALYEKLVRDMSDNAARFQLWWDTMHRKYSWESVSGCKWEIDFESCTVYRIKQ
jgi:CXXX repeat modification system protein